MKLTTLGARLVASGALAACATGGGTARAADPAQLSAAHFSATALVQDDALDLAATISTEPGLQPEPNPLVGRVHDAFLRASVAKATGVATIQVYTWIRYPGSTWRNYTTANYETLSGPAVAPAERLGNPDVDCSLRALGCVYRENLGFLVPERTFRDWASKQQSGEWKFKLTARSGDVYNGSLPAAEVAGLIAKIDEYRAGKRLTPFAGNPPSAPPKE